MCQSNIVFFDVEFIKDVTTTLIGASIGTLTAVWIYIRTNKKERKKEKIRIDRERKNKLLYTSNLISSFKSKLEGTIESLDKLIEMMAYLISLKNRHKNGLILF